MSYSAPGGKTYKIIAYVGDGSLISRIIAIPFQPRAVIIMGGGICMISTDTVTLHMNAQEGGTTSNFNGADGGTYTSSSSIDVGKLAGKISIPDTINSNGFAYTMIIFQ